jgi:hypothetical protein
MDEKEIREKIAKKRQAGGTYFRAGQEMVSGAGAADKRCAIFELPIAASDTPVGYNDFASKRQHWYHHVCLKIVESM